MSRLKVAVLISGRGSNLRALIGACVDPGFPAEIVLVLSNNPEAGGLAYAAEGDLAAVVVDHRDFADKPSFEAAIEAELKRSGADLVQLYSGLIYRGPALVRECALAARRFGVTLPSV